MIEPKVFKGIPAAPGLAKGPVSKFENQSLSVPEFAIQDKDAEIKRLETAREASRAELEELKKKVQQDNAVKEAEIFEAHLMILDDESLGDLAKDDIKAGTNAEAAWMKAVDYFARQLETIPDPLLSERALDVRDVGRRVLKHLMGVSAEGIHLSKPSVILGRDLSPSDTASLDKHLTLGFLTAQGGPTSHTAILAKAFGLPAVVGLGNEILSVAENSLVLIDGTLGQVVVNPTPEMVSDFEEREAANNLARQNALSVAFDPAYTLDGVHAEVVANIGDVDDAESANQNGAEGVGLFRTEFLFLNRETMPGEEEQFTAYREIFTHFQGQPVVVRTLDIGGDKEVPYMNFPKELNPFLGWRGVRILHGREDILSTQIRSLLRASVGVDLRIMVPMVALQEEIDEMKSLIEKEKAHLNSEGVPFGDKVQFGIMVEVPSAALLSDRLAKTIDFFSIGTNDLTQYTLAVDRTNSQVSYLASSFQPSVLYLIQRTITSAHAAGKWCGMCGEFAGEPLALPILIGMGLDEFSMSPARVPEAKQLIRKLRKSDCEILARQALSLTTAQDVKNMVSTFLAERGISIS